MRCLTGRPIGSCAIGTLNCDEAAIIDLHGGDVRIDGLDGRASILKRHDDSKVTANSEAETCTAWVTKLMYAVYCSPGTFLRLMSR